MKSSRVVIVQCRLSSTRLPGKALLTLKEKPVLAWALAAMKKVQAKYYYVATDEGSYSEILPICEKYGFKCFPGSAQDVLKRFCDLLNTIEDAETVIRATADNPFLFYEAAEDSVRDFEFLNERGEKCDYLTYYGLPHGSGVEIFSAESIKKAITETEDPYDHEHVGPALYNHKDRYVCNFVKAPEIYNFPELRTTIDTFSDYLRALNITVELGKEGPYTTQEILDAVNCENVKKPVILMPSVKKGQGTGHLHRCLSLAEKNNYFVYIPENKTLEECDNLVKLYVSKGLDSDLIINHLPDENYKAVYITDGFKLSEEDYENIPENRGIVSFDEGSDYSKYSDYLLDIIPSYGLSRSCNKTDYSLMEKPSHRKHWIQEMEDCCSDSVLGKDSNRHGNKIKNPSGVSKILVCLGGEDPSGFTIPVVGALKDYFTKAKITAVCHDNLHKCENTEYGDYVEFTDNIPDLREKIFNYDIVVTHYGLTAFEGAYAGCGVILLPTTELHKKLAEKYNFAFIPNSNFTKEAIEKVFSSNNLYPELGDYKKAGDLGDFVKEFIKGRKMGCPVCNSGAAENINRDEIISRNNTRTYRRCRKCGMAYMSYTIQPEMHYEKAYFFEDYKKQYGKTYEEDFGNIKDQGLRRVEHIKKAAGYVEGKTLLDIGCAYGPFLAAAADYKIIPFGTDISDDAVAYVANKLNFTAKCCPFPDIDTEREFGQNQFDIVSMWYVIEHFNNLHDVLQKISEIVKKDGIFAFSTPCGEGISAKSDINHFYEISPADHYSIWEISKAGKILEKYGFEIKEIVSTGHHPERFPIIKEKSAEKGSELWNEIDRISHEQQLGDTVEIYCRKIK